MSVNSVNPQSAARHHAAQAQDPNAHSMSLQKRLSSKPVSQPETPDDPAPGGDGGISAAPVIFSPQAKALQQSDGSQATGSGPISLDFAQQLLGSLTGKSLSLLGIVGSGDAGKASISFDDVSVDASSTSALSISRQALTGNDGSQWLHQGVAIGQAQQLKIAGHGTITTADGRKLEFSAELEVDTLAMASADSTQLSGPTAQQSQGGQTASGQDGQTLDFGGTAAQLLSHLFDGQQGGAAPVALFQSAQGDQPAKVLPGALSLSLKDERGQHLGQIDWHSLLADLQSFVDSIGTGNDHGTPSAQQPASV